MVKKSPFFYITEGKETVGENTLQNVKFSGKIKGEMDIKIIANNRSAYHEYFVEEKLEAGIVLEGGEVKSVRLGNVNLKDSYLTVYNGEMYIKNMHISVYDKSGAYNSKDAKRDRKILLKKNEIIKLNQQVAKAGMTVVPLSLYFKGSLIKLEIGVCKGKHTYDKKKSLMEKDLKREKERAIKEYNK